MAKNIVDVYSILFSTAIALEVSAYPKPGNVHRLHDYPDKKYEDYIVTSIVVEKYFRKALLRGMKLSTCRYRTLFCDIVREAVLDTLCFTGGRNTSLGTIFLLTPLALATGYVLSSGDTIDIRKLASTATLVGEKYSTVDDSIEYYRVLRVVKPSYLRKTDETHGYPNIHDRSFKKKLVEKNIRLWELLIYASTKDVVAKQIVDNYRDCIDALEFMEKRLESHGDWNRSVVETYLYMLSRLNDTIVMLKHGVNVMNYVKRRAASILEEILSKDNEWMSLVAKLDNELYTKRINPGSIADLVACVIALKKLCDENILYCLLEKKMH